MKTRYKILLTVIILVSGIICGIVLSFRYSGQVNHFIGGRQLARAEKFMDQKMCIRDRYGSREDERWDYLLPGYILKYPQTY